MAGRHILGAGIRAHGPIASRLPSSGALRWFSRRLAQALLVFVLAYTCSFALINLLPSDPLSLRFSQSIGSSAEQLAELNRYYGFDQPLWLQYFAQLGKLLRGDLGYSIDNGQPVLSLLLEVLPSTFALALTAVGLALCIALGIGLVTWAFPGGRIPRFLRVLPGLCGALPVYWTSIIILQVAAFRMGLFSAFDPTGPAAVLAAATSLAIPVSASIAQALIASLDDFSHSSYLQVVQARGASKLWILRNYLIRAVLPSLLNVLAIVFGTVLTSTVVTEHVFGRSGIGSLMHKSIVEQDLPMVQGVVLFSALVFVTLNIAVDVAGLALDKRQRPWANAALSPETKGTAA